MTGCLYVAKADLELDGLLPQYSSSWDISNHDNVQLVWLAFNLQVEHEEVLNLIFDGVCM